MRGTLVVLALLLTACGGGDGTTSTTNDPATGGATANAAATLDAVATVQAAVERTRTAGTATFVMEGTTDLGVGTLTQRRDGSYDVKARRSEQTQTFVASPPRLLEELLGKDVEPGDLETKVVIDGDTAYVQMAAWPERLRGRWLRSTEEGIAKVRGLDEVDVAVFPSELEMLLSAAAAGRPPSGDTLYVTVPAPDAFRAFPSSTTAKLVAAGVDPGKLTGTVEVAVTVTNGLVTEVSYDALEVFTQAWQQAGQAGQADAVTAIRRTVTLSAHGKPVTVTVPTKVFTPQEMGA